MSISPFRSAKLALNVSREQRPRLSWKASRAGDSVFTAKLPPNVTPRTPAKSYRSVVMVSHFQVLPSAKTVCAWSWRIEKLVPNVRYASCFQNEMTALALSCTNASPQRESSKPPDPLPPERKQIKSRAPEGRG